MKEEQLDIAILGGGLAGLSLAVHLTEEGLGERRVAVLEARDRYEHDRVWCSWASPDHPFRDCIAHTWSGWRVRADSREVVQVGAAERYRCIPSGAFYDHAQRAIATHPGAELRLGTSVHSVRDDGARGVEIVTGDGRRLRARTVLDSRPSRGGAGPGTDAEVDLLQDFVGLHVRCDDAAFDPENVVLMDFLPSQGDVRFVYVLPFSAHEALVESTAFTGRRVADADHDQTVREYLASTCGARPYRVIGRERGVVPMSTRPSRARVSANVTRIGQVGGMVKPSTGYSFEAVQRWSRRTARDLVSRRRPRARPRRSWMLAMDRMFLAYMQRCPGAMPEVFLRLFERVPADVLVRFLSDRCSARDAGQVIAAMPKIPMLATALARWRLWLRR